MPVTELRVQGYRSIRDLTLSLKRVNVIVGPNGCGKSNLYNSISLIRAAATGELAKSLVREGGMPSVLWAGATKKGPVRMLLAVTVDEYHYDLELGLVPASTGIHTGFPLDPEIKSESLIQVIGTSRVKILERLASSCHIRNALGERETFQLRISTSESVFDQIAEPTQFPQLDDIRRRILKWRFYHTFRTDQDSPIRRPQVGTRTPVLSPDGIDLAAALKTILYETGGMELEAFIDDAFPGAKLEIVEGENGQLQVSMRDRLVNRPLVAHELSDGTLRYLCLLAALLSPRPAPLLALNEPETSLHQSLMKPLARLVAKASELSQIWLTTHSPELSEELSDLAVVRPIQLDKVGGETIKAGRAKGHAFSVEDLE